MIALKLFGGVLILTAGVFTAVGSVRRERSKLTALEGWIALIRYIRGQIDCFLTPLDEILLADRSLLRACMGHGNEGSLSELLAASAPLLDEEVNMQLRAFVREMGGSYREEQVKRCDYYLSVLLALREKRTAELPLRIRLCTTLSLCASAWILILLW